MSNELKIEAGKYYRLRNGLRVYVAATNKPGDRPIVGWLDDGMLSTWCSGGCRFNDSPTDYDIISEWVEPERIPWEHLPKWCRWWVKQQGGTEWASADKPTKEAYSWAVSKDEGGLARLPKHLHSNYTGDWRNSLRERPEGV